MAERTVNITAPNGGYTFSKDAPVTPAKAICPNPSPSIDCRLMTMNIPIRGHMRATMRPAKKARCINV